MTPTFTTGVDVFGLCLADIVSGKPPVRYSLPDPFSALDVRPGRLLLFGGAPGGGKTAALLQIGVELLRQNEAARLLVANVEMSPVMLAERIVSRIAGVPLAGVIDRTLTQTEIERVRIAVNSLGSVAGRLAFLNSPYSLEHVCAAGMAFKANVYIVDYLQRFTVGDGKKSQREQLDEAATVLRGFCKEGAALLVASAVARQKSERGSTYAGINLAAFRGSSELEFGCDGAYLLVPNAGGGITLQCEKNRNGAVKNIETVFEGTIQTFSLAPSGLDGFDAAVPAPEKATRAKRK